MIELKYIEPDSCWVDYDSKLAEMLINEYGCITTRDGKILLPISFKGMDVDIVEVKS